MNNIDPKKVVYALAIGTASAVCAELILTWYRNKRRANQTAGAV